MFRSKNMGNIWILKWKEKKKKRSHQMKKSGKQIEEKNSKSHDFEAVSNT